LNPNKGNSQTNAPVDHLEPLSEPELAHTRADPQSPGPEVTKQAVKAVETELVKLQNILCLEIKL